MIEYRLHETVIFQLWPDGLLTLDCGGWATDTTARHLNKHCITHNIPIKVYRRKRTLWVKQEGSEPVKIDPWATFSV